LYIHHPGTDSPLTCALAISLHYGVKPGAQ
jgi:hypothetical protein